MGDRGPSSLPRGASTAKAGFSFETGRKLFLRRDGQLTLYGDWRPWRCAGVLARITESVHDRAAPPVLVERWPP
jgi:hypothetical protein